MSPTLPTDLRKATQLDLIAGLQAKLDELVLCNTWDDSDAELLAEMQRMLEALEEHEIKRQGLT